MLLEKLNFHQKTVRNTNCVKQVILVHCWEYGKNTKTLSGHGSVVTSVSFNSQSMLASGSGNDTVKIWDVTTGQ